MPYAACLQLGVQKIIYQLIACDDNMERSIFAIQLLLCPELTKSFTILWITPVGKYLMTTILD